MQEELVRVYKCMQYYSSTQAHLYVCRLYSHTAINCMEVARMHSYVNTVSLVQETEMADKGSQDHYSRGNSATLFQSPFEFSNANSIFS